jgi:hypothetical protein
MAAPFCTGCGAAVAEGTRFCVKCGQPVSTAAFPTPPPPPPLPPSQVSSPQSGPLPPPPPPPPAPSISQVAQYPAAQDPIGLYPPPQPVKEGAGAGVWIAILGLLLLAAGGGLWFYTTRIHPRQAAQPVTQPTTQPVTQPTPQPVRQEPIQVAAAPTPPAPEAIPPNPDFAKPADTAKNDKAPKTGPRQDTAPPIQTRNRNPPAAGASPPQTAPAPVPPQPVPVKPAGPTSGTLHATVEVAQYGEVVFENLPGGRLKFTFDHSAWQPTIHRQSNGTQTLIMRSLRKGIQRTCDVKWELLE